MHTITTKNQFIELRSQGLTLDAISEQIGVPKPTLGRWHHECLEQIQRLRAVQWDLLEDQIGHRLEDVLERIAERIQKYEEGLDERVPRHMKPIDVLRVIRHSRREYLELRALLLAPLRPARGRTPCLDSLDPQKRDKTRQTTESLDTTSLPQNDLQQMETFLSHSEDAVTPEVTRGQISRPPSEHPATSSANAVHDSATAEGGRVGAPSPTAELGLVTHSELSRARAKLLSVLLSAPQLRSGQPEPAVTPDLRANASVKTELNSRGPISPQPSDHPDPSSADALHDSPPAESLKSSVPSVKSVVNPAPVQSPICNSQFSIPSTPGSEPFDSQIIQDRPCAVPSPVDSQLKEPSTLNHPSPNDLPKKHKPYSINGYYYANPEFPEPAPCSPTAPPGQPQKLLAMPANQA